MLLNRPLMVRHFYNEEWPSENILHPAVQLNANVSLQASDRSHLVAYGKNSLWRYKILKELGDGTCGSVYKAVNLESYEIVAVKKMKRKFYVWEECMNLREVKSLRKLSHPNIIKLKEIVRENNELFFIFEYMEHNLYHIIKDRQSPFSEDEIRNFMTQILQGLAYMHKNGYFHRDLKPENLLVTNNVLKIADFGLAREVLSMPPYTDYVSTRWYRAPEVLLQSTSYTPAVDMWAVGAILAELFTGCPIFPGDSETDQLYKICRVLGAPDWAVFPEARNITQLFSISHSEILPLDLSAFITNASAEAIDLISQLCSWDPLKRPTAEQSLQHPFFHVDMRVPRPIYDLHQLKQNDARTMPNLELNLWDFDARADDCFLGLSLAVKPSVTNMEMDPRESQGVTKDAMFCSNYHDQPNPSVAVFWSLFAPSRGMINSPAEPHSLSLSFSSSISHPSHGASHSTGFPLSSLQPSILDGPLLAMSSPLQQGHYH